VSASPPVTTTIPEKVATRLSTLAWNTVWRCQAAPRRAAAWVRDAVGRRRYPHLTVEELKQTRKSDVVFVFGSGYSLNAITPAEWRAIARHDTVGFNEFHRQSFVRTDYHIAAEVDFIGPYAEGLRSNPLYANTVLVLQEGWAGFFGNTLVGRGLLRAGTRVFRFTRRSRGVYAPPSRSFENGLVHGFGSIIDAVNFAYLTGWRQIVLAGVDLNDRRYFWLRPDEMRPYDKPGFTVDSTFLGAENIVSMLGRWRELLAEEGVSLSVYNPRSLLTRVMPVYTPDSSTVAQ
jgi:hypothetical protein